MSTQVDACMKCASHDDLSRRVGIMETDLKQHSEVCSPVVDEFHRERNVNDAVKKDMYDQLRNLSGDTKLLDSGLKAVHRRMDNEDKQQAAILGSIGTLQNAVATFISGGTVKWGLAIMMSTMGAIVWFIIQDSVAQEHEITDNANTINVHVAEDQAISEYLVKQIDKLLEKVK